MERVGATPIVVEATAAQNIERAFAKISEQRAEALVVAPDTLFVEERRQIAERALKESPTHQGASSGSMWKPER